MDDCLHLLSIMGQPINLARSAVVDCFRSWFRQLAIEPAASFDQGRVGESRGFVLKIGGQKVPTRTLLLMLNDSVLIFLGLILGIIIRFHNLGGFKLYLEDRRMPYRAAWVVLTCTCAL